MSLIWTSCFQSKVKHWGRRGRGVYPDAMALMRDGFQEVLTGHSHPINRLCRCTGNLEQNIGEYVSWSHMKYCITIKGLEMWWVFQWWLCVSNGLTGSIQLLGQQVTTRPWGCVSCGDVPLLLGRIMASEGKIIGCWGRARRGKPLLPHPYPQCPFTATRRLPDQRYVNEGKVLCQLKGWFTVQQYKQTAVGIEEMSQGGKTNGSTQGTREQEEPHAICCRQQPMQSMSRSSPAKSLQTSWRL